MEKFLKKYACSIQTSMAHPNTIEQELDKYKPYNNPSYLDEDIKYFLKPCDSNDNDSDSDDTDDSDSGIDMESIENSQ